MVSTALTPDMMVVLALLVVTVTLFVTEVVRVDLTAMIILVMLGFLSTLPGLGALTDISHLFDGFASNAVISIIAVMIIGAGLDKTGLMSKLAALILKYGGTTEPRIIPIVSGTAGVISSFMQNVGAAALFIPVVSRISSRTELPLSRLLMPMGFCAILGGTLTMVGSSPLILLNDLLHIANEDLPPAQQMKPFSLLDITPVGICLLLSGILYFVLFGKLVLPVDELRTDRTSGQSVADYLKRLYGLNAKIFEVEIPAGNLLVGKTIGDIMEVHHMYVIGSYYKGLRVVAPVASTEILTPCRLAIMGDYHVVQDIVDTYGLKLFQSLEIFAEEFAPTQAGVAELVIPPDSSLIGKCAKDLGFRKGYGLNLLAIHRGEGTFSHVETDDHKATRIGLIPIHVGDTLVVQTQWSRLTKLKKDRNFVIVTSDFPQEELRPHKVRWALIFFFLTMSLILFTDIRLSLSLMLGAVGMIASKVLTIDEAYEAVGWSTVFLLAGLIPLGQAVQSTGTAEWIAAQLLFFLGDLPIWGLQGVVAVLSAIFTLIMSNVGATVLLVPLAISIAIAAGGDPAIFAITVAISTSNSFLIPTHQVNALIMGPAGYTVSDFIRTGGAMTVIFFVVSMIAMNVFL